MLLWKHQKIWKNQALILTFLAQQHAFFTCTIIISFAQILVTHEQSFSAESAKNGSTNLYHSITKHKTKERHTGLRWMAEEFFHIWMKMDSKWDHIGYGYSKRTFQAWQWLDLLAIMWHLQLESSVNHKWHIARWPKVSFCLYLDDKFIVVASDGLWEFISNEEVL